MPLESPSNHSPSPKKNYQLPSHSQSHQSSQESPQNSSAIRKVNSSALNHVSNGYSPSVLNLLEQPPASFPLRFLLGGLIFCLAFGSWAWFGKVEEVGRAQGTLVPQGKTYKVEPSTNGRIKQLLIEEGDTVAAGEVLASLDAEELKQEINKIEQRLETYQNQLQQQQNLLQVKKIEALNGEEIANSDLKVQSVVIANAQEQLMSKTQQLAALQQEVNQNKQRLERLQPLEKSGAISQEYVFQAQQALQDSKMKVLQLQSEINATRKEAERLEVELAQKDQQKTRTQLEAEQQIKQLEINIEELQGKIIETKNELAIAKNQEQETFLQSPVDGTVLSLNLQNIGQVLQPGQTIAEIAPKDSPLVLDAMIANQEAGFLEKNMDVNIKFDAYPYQDYGVVEGKVLSISPTSKTTEKGTFYQVEIALDRNYIQHNQQTIQFQPGQSASAEIVTRRRRIAEVIFEPLRKLRESGFKL
ncbi:secretion protein HlyD family protein [Halothece sp. PCC 7418]|uniref:HlyD family type I secretion periplasmic adaptor subunit n=1 Tax=Halothece sp. (strain PCC 7418) TaxID=65093 RepID=UPI0002A06314|nr:HlyD family type I secretion periplasmic adaptor subunit [Halothece sp. PCC 7418]AFZ43300.1 secretion protein HlyD family protein [Halothece sp. PCC 7418]